MDGIINTNISQQMATTGVSQTKNSNSTEKLSPSVDGTGFGDTLNEAIDKVNTLHQVADQKTEDIATGKSSNLHETMIAVEKADIAMKLMVQVRNKMIDAYQEIMKMQV